MLSSTLDPRIIQYVYQNMYNKLYIINTYIVYPKAN